MRQFEFRGVQALPREERRMLFLKLRRTSAVNVIAEHRVPDRRHVDADLMRSARLEFHFGVRKAGQT